MAVPGAPTPFQVTAVTTTSITGNFSGTTDGGSPILEWQIGYGTDPNFVMWTVSSPGSSEIGLLQPGTMYYFWVRARNAFGWSAWSTRTAQATGSVPEAPGPVSFSDITQDSVKTSFQGRGSGGYPIIEYRLGFGTSSESPQFMLITDGTNNLTSLKPGERYYFWSQARNQFGYSALSERSSVLLIAGAMVAYSRVWRRAVPYVYYNGSWRLARPYVKEYRGWKRTS